MAQCRRGTTFKGMLKILINDYLKQHQQKMLPLVLELMKTQRELREVKEQLRVLQSRDTASSCNTSDATISLFVQYNGFFNQLCDIQKSMTIEDLVVRLRQLTGISTDRQIRLRVLSEDDLTTIFFIDKDTHRTLGSYCDCLKPRMILNIEDNDQDQSCARSKNSSIGDKTYSFDESDV